MSAIGRCIAETVAESGDDVVAWDHKLGLAEETARLLAAHGRRTVALRLDVTDPALLEAAVARTLEAFGRLDGWVNNAGTLHMAAALDFTREAWEAEMQVNVAALFACCQAA